MYSYIPVTKFLSDLEFVCRDPVLMVDMLEADFGLSEHEQVREAIERRDKHPVQEWRGWNWYLRWKQQLYIKE